MIDSNRDTIAACATPPGRGGVGIVRVSGEKTLDIAKKLLGEIPKPRYAHFSAFKDEKGNVLDKGLALTFKGPNSFTGEDVLELHGHGGPVIIDALLKTILKMGARLARPGEFTERAFLNDKIDLAQAEAVADLIDAQSTQAAQSALRSLQGEFSTKVNMLKNAMINLRIAVEAAIDFPEEEIDFLSDGHIEKELIEIIQALETVKNSAKQGVLLKEGMTVVIAGKPNAGKSSLLNRLSGENAAIVTDVPGTTRDVLRQHIQIDGLPLHIVDTAGLRESDDKVEQEGVRRAQMEIEKADRVLFVIDASENYHDKENVDLKALEVLPKDILARIEGKPVTFVYNKIDLVKGKKTSEISAAEVQGEYGNREAKSTQFGTVHLSAKTGEGIDALKAHLKASMGFDNTLEGQFIARRRHVDALVKAGEHLQAGQEQLLTYRAGELLAEELRCAHDALGVITGEFRPDDLLGEIFSSFCIGK